MNKIIGYLYRYVEKIGETYLMLVAVFSMTFAVVATVGVGVLNSAYGLFPIPYWGYSLIGGTLFIGTFLGVLFYASRNRNRRR